MALRILQEVEQFQNIPNVEYLYVYVISRGAKLFGVDYGATDGSVSDMEPGDPRWQLEVTRWSTNHWPLLKSVEINIQETGRRKRIILKPRVTPKTSKLRDGRLDDIWFSSSSS